MRRVLLTGLLLLSLMVSLVDASPITVVDTGAGPNTGSTALVPHEWLAAEFSVAQDVTIRQVQLLTVMLPPNLLVA